MTLVGKLAASIPVYVSAGAQLRGKDDYWQVHLVDVRVLTEPLTRWWVEAMHTPLFARGGVYRPVSSLPDTVFICPSGLWAAIEGAG